MIPCSHYTSSRFGIISLFFTTSESSQLITYYRVLSLVAGNLRRGNRVKHSIWTVQTIENQCARPMFEAWRVNYHGWISSLNLTAHRSQPGQSVLNQFPHTSPKRSISEDLAAALICQHIWEQFQEMMWAKHLRKRPEIEPEALRGPTGGRGQVFTVLRDNLHNTFEKVRTRTSRTRAWRGHFVQVD